MQIDTELYSGKAKSVFTTADPDKLILRFRDDTSAFDGEKIEKLARKGAVNNKVNAHVMRQLENAGIPTHFERQLTDNETLVKRLAMIPVECVVRNITAGSICRRLGIAEGIELNEDELMKSMHNAIEKGYEHKTSMLLDIINKRKTEVDFFNGKIIELGRKHNIQTPLNLLIYGVIKALEYG